MLHHDRTAWSTAAASLFAPECACKCPVPLQAMACTSMLHHDRTAWSTSAAPEPRDLIWSNLGCAPAPAHAAFSRLVATSGRGYVHLKQIVENIHWQNAGASCMATKS